MKTVKVCDDSFQAYVVRERLEGEGIPATVLNENASRLIPFAAAVSSLDVRVAVADADYERALALLGENGIAGIAKICPECGSANVRMTLSKNRVKRIGIALLVCLCALFQHSPGHIRYHFSCKDCGAEFH